ncbi:hypothetical protein BKK79_00875 [Cupriavidus sp. USMAA2-4]|uniref:hypothetical protein n=1 Tax=Cupriavidus sp. USMAA2-4 TaxID=876364 RepID=UPI0008A6B6B6|nr:hypothetical protein [Cupriavidus sp. USMAA2-4]AOY90539.1 hypothetical protein BKK79_00875 [Cupriavidus sp. USMAA2-4]
MSQVQIKRPGEADRVTVEALDENGHRFVTGGELGFTEGSVLYKARCCFDCGIVRRADGQNKACRGRVSVEVRAA